MRKRRSIHATFAELARDQDRYVAELTGVQVCRNSGEFR
jgi:hypothetical protein